MEAYKALMSFQHRTEALNQVAERLAWDQETMMPRGAAGQRAEEIAAIQGILHSRRTDTRISDWLEKCAEASLNKVELAQLYHIKRDYDRNSKIPERLATEIAKVTSISQGVWASARSNDSFSEFAPMLQEVVSLRKEQATILAEDRNLYDTLLDEYEPSAKCSDLRQMFNALRPHLINLRSAILENSNQPNPIKGYFDPKKQMVLAKFVAEAIGYDFNCGRLDTTIHPFASGSGQDVRITTRTDTQNPFDCLYSTIHEVGHAIYEQNINKDFAFTPLGHGVSMGVHESQSRIFENQLGRSRAFTGWLYKTLKDEFGDFGVANEEVFYAISNQVSRGYIRTEADEVQYNLHIMLRFELEQELIGDNLPVADLEVAWNDRFEKDFGTPVDRASNGVLQDVHWSLGCFGYFPTYSLGNVYAGCLFEALQKDIPRLDNQLSQGDLRGAREWLEKKIQQFGSLHKPKDLILSATGQHPSEKPLITYLKEKFTDLYKL